MDRQRIFKTKRHLRKIMRLQIEKERLVIDSLKKKENYKNLPSTIEDDRNDADNINISNHSNVSIP